MPPNPSLSSLLRGYAMGSLPLRCPKLPGSYCIAMMATEATQAAKKGGTIADVFTTLGPCANVAPLPARFSAVKKDVLHDMGVTSDVLELAWKSVLKALEPRVQEIVSQGGGVSFVFTLCDWQSHTQILLRSFHVSRMQM